MAINNLQSEYHVWLSEAEAGRATGSVKWRGKIAGNPNYQVKEQYGDRVRAFRRMSVSSLKRIKDSFSE